MISDWEKAYKDMLNFEGGYANNSKDRGGETYKGIARNVWRNWPGWNILDYYKSIGNTTAAQINQVMRIDKRIEPLVKTFYKENFWDKAHGDELPSKLARKAFDTAVNMGIKWGILLLQRSINGLNTEEKILAAELVEDGKYGRKTKEAIKKAIEFYGAAAQDKILNWYCRYQAERYQAIVTHNPSQKIFLKGWLRRAAYRGE